MSVLLSRSKSRLKHSQFFMPTKGAVAGGLNRSSLYRLLLKGGPYLSSSRLASANLLYSLTNHSVRGAFYGNEKLCRMGSHLNALLYRELSVPLASHRKLLNRKQKLPSYLPSFFTLTSFRKQFSCDDTRNSPISFFSSFLPSVDSISSTQKKSAIQLSFSEFSSHPVMKRSSFFIPSLPSYLNEFTALLNEKIFSHFFFPIGSSFSTLLDEYEVIEKNNFYLDNGHKYTLIQPVSRATKHRTLSPVISRALLTSFSLFPYEATSLATENLYPMGRVIDRDLFSAPEDFSSIEVTDPVRDSLLSYWSTYLLQRRLYRYRLRFYFGKSTLWRRRSYRGFTKRITMQWFFKRAKLGLKLMKQKLAALPIFPHFLFFPFRFMHFLSVSIHLIYPYSTNLKNMGEGLIIKATNSSNVGTLLFDESFDLTLFESFPFILHYVKHLFRQYIIVPQAVYDYYYQTRLYNFYYLSFHLSVAHHYSLSYNLEAALINLSRGNMFYFFDNFYSYIVHSDYMDPIVLTSFTLKNNIQPRHSSLPQNVVSPFSLYKNSSIIKSMFVASKKTPLIPLKIIKTKLKNVNVSPFLRRILFTQTKKISSTLKLACIYGMGPVGGAVEKGDKALVDLSVETYLSNVRRAERRKKRNFLRRREEEERLLRRLSISHPSIYQSLIARKHIDDDEVPIKLSNK